MYQNKANLSLAFTQRLGYEAPQLQNGLLPYTAFRGFSLG